MSWQTDTKQLEQCDNFTVAHKVGSKTQDKTKADKHTQNIYLPKTRQQCEPYNYKL